MRRNTNSRDGGRASTSVGRLAWRAFWTAVFVVHLLAFRSTVETLVLGDSASIGDALTRGLGLSLGITFCGLKLLDVQFLRLKPGWRSTVAAGVAIALLHVGALDRTPDHGGTISPSQVGVVLFVCAFVDVRALAAGIRQRLTVLKRLLHSEEAHVHLNPYLRAVEALFEPTQSSFEPCLVVPRAPPLGC